MPKQTTPDGIEGISGAIWEPTMQLRWFRPERAGDHEVELQQLYRSRTCEEEWWRTIPTVMAD